MIAPARLDTLRVLPPPNTGAGFSGSFRANIYELRFRAGEILGGRQRTCGCRQININEGVGVIEDADKKHFFSGVQTCGSVWTCPVCALKISKQRSLEVAHILKQMQGENYSLGFLTLTWKHNHKEELEVVLKRGMKVYREMCKHRVYKTLEEGSNVIGNIRALEVKFGANGWHPHLHIAIVGECKPDILAAFASAVKHLWMKLQGENATMEAQKYKPIYCEQGIAEYITKWQAADEMTKGHMKSEGKHHESLTPFAMLEKIHCSKTVEAQKIFYRAKFHEYGDVMKGRKQLTRGRKLIDRYKDILQRKREKEIEIKSDEEIVKQKHEGTLVFTIESELFNEVVGNNLQAHILNVYAESGIIGIQELLLECGIFTQFNEQTNLLSIESG